MPGPQRLKVKTAMINIHPIAADETFEVDSLTASGFETTRGELLLKVGPF